MSRKRLKVEIVYQDRTEWPKHIVDGFHKLHLKWGTQNPKCPYCNGTWKWNKQP